MEVQVNTIEEVKVSIVKNIASEIKKQSTIEDYQVKKSRAYHFVSTCKWDYPDFKGVIHKIDQNKPYLMVKELGKEGGQEHHHLYFYSPKSLNTIKKYLTEHKFLNLKYSDPANPKNVKYNDPREFKDLEKYDNIGCLVYLVKGKTNHMVCRDDLKVTPEISCDNIEDLGSLRDLYEEIIKEMREKRDILVQEKVDSKEKKKEIELFRFFQYIEECKDYMQLPHFIGRFFLENSDIIHSEHKAFGFYKSALKKLYPNEYKEFVENCVLKKIQQLTVITI